MLNLTKQIQQQFDKMCATGKLFRVAMTGNEVWSLYLKSFPSDKDLVFRDPESSEHNCNHCHNFIRRYGNVVAIDADNKIMSMFDVEGDEEYAPSMNALSKAIKSFKILEVFFETFAELNSLPYESCTKSNTVFRLGTNKNVKRYTKEEADKFGVVKKNQIITFDHFYLSLPKEFVDMTGNSVESIMGIYRDNKNVFQRGMEEISLDTLLLVRDLINQNSLLDGATHLSKLEKFIIFKKEYDELAKKDQDNWCWVASNKLAIAKFRNELIGTLCVELTEGKELNEACQTWNKRVDPANYMKAIAPITKAQIKQAQEFVEENGYAESFNRRLATIDDINVSEILHANAGDGKLKKVSLFDNVKATSTQHKRSEFDGIEEVTIDKFMTDILPNCTGIEAFLSNDKEGNMVTLTTAEDKNSKPIFKWDNNYSWTFNGNLAGKSQLTEMVEAKGGRTDGAFRFTHSWNELEPNQSLMDLHVFMPGCRVPKTGGGPNITGRRVGWNLRTDVASGGTQDVDYTSPAPHGYIPVENITFPTLSKMPEGLYSCVIHNWSFRQSGGRGKAEIAFQGNLYQYEYPKTTNEQWVVVAEVTLKDGKFTIDHKLPLTGETNKEIYGLETNSFHKVNLVCLSPNHWGDNKTGNKHYFFMLNDCKVPGSIRSFHNENLNSDLVAHRKVMEVLSAQTMVEEPKDKQLSGLGFNATVSDELVVKLTGSFKRVVRIKF